MTNKEFFENGIRYAEGDNGLFMFFSSANKDECIRKINSGKIKNVTFHKTYAYEGFNDDNLDILKGINLSKIIISPGSIKDFSGINSQNNLLFLRIIEDPVTDTIDFDNFPRLEVFEGYWTKHLRNLFDNKTLKTLWLWKYKSKSDDLSGLSKMENLEELHIIQSKITTCRGIEKLKKLKKLDLSYNNRLEVFSEGEVINSQLQEVEIEFCRKLDLATLDNLKNLKILKTINNGKPRT